MRQSVPASTMVKGLSMTAHGLLVPAAEHVANSEQTARAGPIILSFDVEEHHRIEAASGLAVPTRVQAYYRDRVDVMTRWLLDLLAHRRLHATFFVLGQIAADNPDLVRAIADGGHEVASHGCDHRRLHNITPARFRDDVRRSKDVLEQASGRPVIGYRAPTFSIVPETLWALDVLVEEGYRYDSSIYPVHHDRYGIPLAPRTPFYAEGSRQRILEIPPVTLRMLGVNLPVGGGGYFRILPLFFLHWAISQTRRTEEPPVVMLYFHPWEFDPEQQRLPLQGLGRFRTYVGLNRSRRRMETLLDSYRFTRAADVVQVLEEQPCKTVFRLAAA
jgi:polysaccharide deacetylase family protein (PEP-CTERM system associated)